MSAAVEEQFASGDLQVSAYVAQPANRLAASAPGLVLCHGFPAAGLGAVNASAQLPGLADRIAEAGWVVVALTFRGCGNSEGDFSLGGWLDDVRSATARLAHDSTIGGVWLAGFGTGGALCITEGSRNPVVRGVAAVGAPADFDDWAGNPRQLLLHARQLGLIRQPHFPPSFDTWARQLRQVRAVAHVGNLAPRPLLVLHGSDDELVPSFDARVLGDAHGAAELRIIEGAGHDLRDDPRAVAVLLGWLERQQRTVFS